MRVRLPIGPESRLHPQVTRTLALQVVRSNRAGHIINFPKEADLCSQLGVSRSILRESMKVLTDKGMIEMKPRAGTRSRPAEHWNRLDPDILCWQAEVGADANFLQQLCEVRLAIEPTAAGFAAVRATPTELAGIRSILDARQQAQNKNSFRRQVELDLDFQAAVVRASHNPMLVHLAACIRQPFRMALEAITRTTAEARLNLEVHEALVDSLDRHDALGARRAAEELVGLAMLAAGEGRQMLHATDG